MGPLGPAPTFGVRDNSSALSISTQKVRLPCDAQVGSEPNETFSTLLYRFWDHVRRCQDVKEYGTERHAQKTAGEELAKLNAQFILMLPGLSYNSEDIAWWDIASELT